MSELYELPEGWEWKEWKDIVNVKNGKHYKDVLNPNGKYPIYGSGGIMNYADEYLCNENTTIIGRKGTINSPIFIEEKFWNIDTAFGLEAKQKYLVPLYLYYFAVHFDFLTLNKSTTLPSLAKSNLQKIMMPLPPLQEQKRIVAKLDNLFAKINQAITFHQQNIDEAESLMGSVLDEVFGELEERYEKKLLGDLTTTTSGGTPKRNEKSYWGGNIGWLKSGELNNGYITEIQEYISEKGLKESSAKLFPKGTLLIAMYGATVGKLAILDIETTTNQAICGILNDKGLFETKYMFYFFQKSKEKMLLDSTGGAQPNISQTYLKQLEVIYPPLKTQQKTVQYLDQLSQKTQALKKEQQEKMQSLKDLKASILDRAFRGEL